MIVFGAQVDRMNEIIAKIVGFLGLIGGPEVKVGPLAHWESPLGKRIRTGVESIAVLFSRLPIFGRIVSAYVEVNAQLIASIALSSRFILNSISPNSAIPIAHSNSKRK